MNSADRVLTSRAPLAVLFIGLLGTALMTGLVYHFARARDEIRFHHDAVQIQEAIERRLETYIVLQRGVVGLFLSSDTVSAAEFHEYVKNVNAEKRYPGIQGLGFTAALTDSQIPELEETMRAQGIPDFRVWPRTDRKDYNAIVFLEPLDRRNRAAIGFDMGTEATRRAAMAKARDTGLPVASGIVTLVQEIDENRQPGFLIYVPVYRRDMPLRTVEERRAALRGFVYSPFRAVDMFSAIFPRPNQLEVRFSLYDGDRPDAEKLLYTSGNPDFRRSRSYAHTNSFQVAGRTWTLQVAPTRKFLQGSQDVFVPLVAAGGLLISLLMFALTRSLELGRASAERLVGELQILEEEQKRTIEVAEAARLEAESANRLKDEFLATVSHELRTPLNAIMGWVHLLRGENVPAEEVASGLDTIERNAKLQAELVNDLLDISRILSGTMRLDLQPIYLEPLIEAAIDTVHPAAAAKEIHLESKLDFAAGPVLGDQTRVQQIITNLLSNAVKFTGTRGRIKVELAREGDYARVSVTDDGQGISPEFLPYVFNVFRQADGSSTRKHGGLGLGLAIVRNLVELQGGTVEAQSEGLAKGSSFMVRLPMATAPERAPRTGKWRLVLVIEDGSQLPSTLAEAGIEIHVANSVQEIQQMIPQFEPHALVLEGNRAVELIGPLRALPVNERIRRPVLALTASLNERRSAILAGFDAHLSTPVNVDELLGEIRRLRPW